MRVEGEQKHSINFRSSAFKSKRLHYTVIIFTSQILFPSTSFRFSKFFLNKNGKSFPAFRFAIIYAFMGESRGETRRNTILCCLGENRRGRFWKWGSVVGELLSAKWNCAFTQVWNKFFCVKVLIKLWWRKLVELFIISLQNRFLKLSIKTLKAPKKAFKCFHSSFFYSKKLSKALTTC